MALRALIISGADRGLCAPLLTLGEERMEKFNCHRLDEAGPNLPRAPKMMDMQRGNRTASRGVLRVEARSSGKQARGRARDEQGQAMVEFAFGVPLLLTLLIGLVVFGVAFNNNLQLTYATDSAAQKLSISRGQTSDPCSTTSTAVEQAAPYLKSSNLTFSLAMGSGNPVTFGTPVTGTSCSSVQLVASQSAQVKVTYPCNLQILGFNPAPNCALTAQTTVLIQ